LAAPNNANGVPSFRALVAADIPNLSWSKITSDKPTTLNGYGITDAVKAVTSTDNAIARFDGTSGQIQNSGVIIDDNNNLTLPSTLIKFTGMGEGMELSLDNNYFGSNGDARILSIIDSNPGTGSTAVDGGFII